MNLLSWLTNGKLFILQRQRISIIFKHSLNVQSFRFQFDVANNSAQLMQTYFLAPPNELPCTGRLLKYATMGSNYYYYYYFSFPLRDLHVQHVQWMMALHATTSFGRFPLIRTTKRSKSCICSSSTYVCTNAFSNFYSMANIYIPTTRCKFM